MVRPDYCNEENFQGDESFLSPSRWWSHGIHMCKVTDQWTVNFTMYNVYFNKVHKTLNMIKVWPFGGVMMVPLRLTWGFPELCPLALGVQGDVLLVNAGSGTRIQVRGTCHLATGRPGAEGHGTLSPLHSDQRFLQRFSLSWPLLANICLAAV